MSDSSVQIVHRLEDKVNQLLTRYEEQRLRNTALARENMRLQSALEESEQKLADITDKFNIYKTVTGLSGSGSQTDKENAQKRIEKLVREIDKCIALLNQ
ncbi:MAG: cell division protein ZapB [Bacteroidia bacterium]|nr:cell division protein ZapB [Bacteroidia bacterium]